MKGFVGSPSVPGSTIDIGLRQYLVKVYNYMAGGLAVTGVADGSLSNPCP